MGNKLNMSLEELREWIKYTPETGEILKIKGRGAGSPAGYKNPMDYISLSLNYQTLPASRVVWFYQTGVWPKKGDRIHYRDGNKENLRWDNLEKISASQVMIKRTLRKQTLGHNMNKKLPLGVYENTSGTYRAHISINRKYIHLGTYLTVEEAEHIARQAREEYGKEGWLDVEKYKQNYVYKKINAGRIKIGEIEAERIKIEEE